ncbi:poly(A)-specific ribonuclease PARN isoform X1 [Dendroctonus ponderosae]|uniref:Poly(A)-specific ribonuclease RNA-binding domain-containing protein n=1 Tax=Dendroctonus ponderosae TaxID=77166 RepID=A0AAR5PJM9_DENPD|nr:poly(A)-specific ribonuclease PARN isoform X1 [Dendroctonus ponderosae]
MEVTQANFKAVLPQIEQAIRDCLFISVDCELTGLKTEENSVNTFDTPKQYYEKARKDCKEFLVVQYGITLFRLDETTDSIKHKSYNFYTFRRPINHFIQDKRFLSQTSCIDFLIQQSFDFNKLFREGISYLNNVEEDEWRNTIKEQQRLKTESYNSNYNRNHDIVLIPEANQEFIDDVVKQLEAFLASNESELQLPKCNSFLRRLLYQTNSEKFHDKIHLRAHSVNSERILFATKLKCKEESEEIDRIFFEKLKSELDDYIGFSQVIRMIVKSEKIIVGHNFLLDFLHTIDKFLTPLPHDYLDFKDVVKSLFPAVYDTKFIGSSQHFKSIIPSTVLGQLVHTVTTHPFNLPPCEIEQGGQGYDINDSKEHEAGYDSFITGLSFLAMWKHLGDQHNLILSDLIGRRGEGLLKPYKNKIFLMILADNQFLDLEAPDQIVSRDHVFYLTFPKEWTTNNIVQLFSPFGNVYVSWISKTSAYVALYKRDQAALALKTLCQSDTYSIITFARRQRQLAGADLSGTVQPSPIKRRIITNETTQSKRNKTGKFEGSSIRMSKRSIEPIEEEAQSDEDEDNFTASKPRTFAECKSWD